MIESMWNDYEATSPKTRPATIDLKARAPEPEPEPEPQPELKN
jgi:hypothetical protein